MLTIQDIIDCDYLHLWGPMVVLPLWTGLSRVPRSVHPCGFSKMHHLHMYHSTYFPLEDGYCTAGKSPVAVKWAQCCELALF